MKKRFEILISVLFTACLCFLAAACFSDEPSPTPDAVSYTVTYQAAAGGFVQGDSVQTVAQGGDGKEVQAVAQYGYIFSSWSDGTETAARKETNVQADITLTAFFEKLQEIEINYIASEGGSLSGNSKQYVPYGQDATIVTAIPDRGYEFTRWSDGVMTAIRSDEVVTQPFSVTAYFKKVSFMLRYTADEGGRIVGANEQCVEYGDNSRQITAVPDVGYKFVRWSDNGSSDPVRADKDVKKDVNAFARFELIFADGKGTEQNPVLIADYAQLLQMKDQPNLYYKLSGDLDLSGVDHEPLFDNENMFSGIFDGCGHAVKNMTVSGKLGNFSLFGCISTGEVRNLNIIDFVINAGDSILECDELSVGAAAGFSDGILKDISVSGEINCGLLNFNEIFVGGLAGKATGSIESCRTDVVVNVECALTATDENSVYIGGLAGMAACDVASCQAQGDITVKEARDNVFVGGLVGYVAVAAESDVSFYDCLTQVEIVSESVNVAGGLICAAKVDGILDINKCAVFGNISGGSGCGGFIYYLSGGRESAIGVRNSCAENDIATNLSAGFIYNANSVAEAEITDCYTKGRNEGRGAGGFCYILSRGIKIYRCYSDRTLNVEAMSASFIVQMQFGLIEECFSKGTINAKYQGAGFVFQCNDTTIKNCYSSADVNILNTDAHSQWRTYACGIAAVSLRNVIINCYYSGKVSGFVYTTPHQQASVVGEFLGYITSSTVSNCYLLHYEDTFAADYIDGVYSSDVDLTVLNNVSEMSSLTQKLNEGLSRPVWTTGENGLPQLIFTAGI